MEASNTLRKSFKLTRHESRRLEDYIASKWDEIVRERPQQAEVAEQAGKDLGLKLSKNHVAAAADVLGREWPQPKRSSNGHGRGNGSIIRVRMDLLILADLVGRMYRDLGNAIPAQLSELVVRLNQQLNELKSPTSGTTPGR